MARRRPLGPMTIGGLFSVGRVNDVPWLLKYHAGCTVDAVVTALDVVAHELFPETRHGRWAPVRVSHALTGSEISRRLRREQPPGNSSWRWVSRS